MAQVTPHAAFARRSPSGRTLTSHDFSEARRPHASHMPGLPTDIHRPVRATGSAGYGVDIDRPRSAIDADSDHVGPASSRRRGLPIGAYQAKGLPATAGGARRRRLGRLGPEPLELLFDRVAVPVAGLLTRRVPASLAADGHRRVRAGRSRYPG